MSIYSSWGFSINAIACCAVSVFALIIGAYSQKRKMIGAEMSVLLAFAAIFLWSFSDGSFSTLAFKIYVPGWPILNMFVFSLLVPSIAMGYFALKICGGKTGRAVFGIGALILFFLFLNFQLRFCFQGNYLWGKTTEIESYAYSPLWLGFGLLLLFLCNKFEILRYVSLVASYVRGDESIFMGCGESRRHIEGGVLCFAGFCIDGDGLHIFKMDFQKKLR